MLGVDIGGTFTDVVALHVPTGERRSSKVLTNLSEPVAGILRGVDEVRAGLFDWQSISELVHGTTLVTNTVLERKGARVGLVGTAGFTDVIEIGNGNRYDIYDLQIEAPAPLVLRRHRFGVHERLSATGHVLTPLDAESVLGAAHALRDVGAESIAICFLHSYANDVHESEAAAMLRTALPGTSLSLSSEVAPIVREYERFVATTINAYVSPVVSDYLNRLRSELEMRGFAGRLGIMKSDGGMCTSEQASRRPVQLLESGPAAGALASARVAGECGRSLAVAFDMGGTTAKACLITDGTPAITDELEVSRQEKFKKGSGLPVHLPSVDLIEVGAGGGSIARIGPLGLLTVGPKSAGSLPGPACYGLGGTEPTVTDADLVLGYLDPAYFAGGAMNLDPDAASRAIRTGISGGSSNDDVVAAAWAIHDLVNEKMALAIRLHYVERGVDPTKLTLIATGGAGPVHAAHVVEKLGVEQVICPPNASVASALGLILAPTSIEMTITDVALLAPDIEKDLPARLDRLVHRALALHGELAEFDADFWLHMRRRGQGSELRVPLPDSRTFPAIRDAFAHEHTRLHGRVPELENIEIVNWTVRLQVTRSPSVGGLWDLPERDFESERNMYFGPARGWIVTEVLSRDGLDEARRPGPLLIQEEASSIVVPPGMSAFADEYGNVHVENGRR